MDLQELCTATRALVADVAGFIQEHVGKIDTNEIEDKAHNSLVSYVDKTAEEKLVKGLTELLPEATFLTEEGTVENVDSPLKWVIDPLDGTTNFLHSVPVFCVSVALVKEDEPILGIVHEVNRNECFYAWTGGGAFLNGSPISVKQNDALSDALLATGFPGRKFDWLPKYIISMEALVKSSRGLRRLGAAAVDMAYVACGRFDGYFEYGLSPWDIAAGILLVKEAGGKLTDFKGGKDFLYSGQMVASNGQIHDALMERIAIGLGQS